MELRVQVFFQVLVLVFSLALTQVEANEIGVNDVGHLFATRNVLYYKKGSTKSALANHSSLLHENLNYHYAKGLAFYQPNFGSIASVPLVPKQSSSAPVVKVENRRLCDLVSIGAVDWLHDRVIYSCFKVEKTPDGKIGTKNTVVSADLQLGDKKILQDTNAVSLTSVVVDPFAGKLFWINDLFNVVSCNLNGSDYKVIMTMKKKNEDLVTNLALDLSNKRIFYIETLNSASVGNYTVSSSDYQGGHVNKNLFTWNKVSGTTQQKVRSIYSLRGRLFAIISKETGKEKLLVVQSLRNATALEGETVVTVGGNERSGGLNDPNQVLGATLVHPDLQPSSDPSV